jgi:hypothetical protein
MEEGVSQGCPLSPIFASLVVSTLLQPLDIKLRERAATRLRNGDQGMMVSEALPIFLVMLTTFPPVSHSRTYNFYATDLLPLELH